MSLAVQSLYAHAQRATAYTDPPARKSHQYVCRKIVPHHDWPRAKCRQKHLQLSDYYVNGLIRPSMFSCWDWYNETTADHHNSPVKALGGLTPPDSDHPSRGSAEIQKDINATIIESAKHDHGVPDPSLIGWLYVTVSSTQGAVYTMPELFVEGHKTEYTQAACGESAVARLL